MLGQLRSPSLQKQLMQAIATLAKRDLRPLEKLLDSPEEFIVQKLVCVLGLLKDEKSTQLLLRMTHHPAEKVRKQAVIQLLSCQKHFIKHLFPMIEDPSPSVRRLILDELGREKNPSIEALLLDYFEQARFKITDHQHLMACYRALGRCGSSDCIPFLRSSLFNRGWILDFGRSVHRKGAVVALVSLRTEEAIELLHKASRSLLPSVRFAYHKALEVN
jgi:HEAT repeat protein